MVRDQPTSTAFSPFCPTFPITPPFFFFFSATFLFPEPSLTSSRPYPKTLPISSKRVCKMGKQPDTELTVLDIPSRSTTDSAGNDLEGRPPQQKDLVYVEGVKNDSGPVGLAIARLWKRRDHGLSLDDVATQPSVFDDEKLAPIYQPGPEYENTHRFNPDLRWTWREEIPIIRKIDWRVTAWAAIGKKECLGVVAPEVHRFFCSKILSNQAYLQPSSCWIFHAKISPRQTRTTSWTIPIWTPTISTPPQRCTVSLSCAPNCLLS
jgi:hypothetical protein